MTRMFRLELRLLWAKAVGVAAAGMVLVALWLLTQPGSNAGTRVLLVSVVCLTLFGIVGGRQAADGHHVPVLLARTRDRGRFLSARVAAVAAWAIAIDLCLVGAGALAGRVVGIAVTIPLDAPIAAAWLAGTLAIASCILGRWAAAVAAGAFFILSGTLAPAFHAPLWQRALAAIVLGTEAPEFMPSLTEGFEGAFHASVTAAHIVAQVTHLALLTIVAGWAWRWRDLR